MEQLDGPVDLETGLAMLAPVPLSPRLACPIRNEDSVRETNGIIYPPQAFPGLPAPTIHPVATSQHPQTSRNCFPQQRPAVWSPTASHVDGGPGSPALGGIPTDYPNFSSPYASTPTAIFPPAFVNTPTFSAASRHSSFAPTYNPSDTSRHERLPTSPKNTATPSHPQAESISPSSNSSATHDLTRHATLTPSTNKIILQSLPPSLSPPHIRHLLEHDLHLSVSRVKQSKGTTWSPAYITFRINHDADLAVQLLDGKIILGSELQVRLDLQERGGKSAVGRKAWTNDGKSESSSTSTSADVDMEVEVDARREISLENKLAKVRLGEGPCIVDGSLEP